MFVYRAYSTLAVNRPQLDLVTTGNYHQVNEVGWRQATKIKAV